MLVTLTELFICLCVICIHQGGRTPLFVAAENKHEAVVSVLLAAGADTNLQNKVPLLVISAAPADDDNCDNT